MCFLLPVPLTTLSFLLALFKMTVEKRRMLRVRRMCRRPGNTYMFRSAGM